MKGIGRRLEHKQKREKQQKECKVTGYQFQSKWRSIAGCRLLLRTLEFQPSFIVKLLFLTVLRGACFREQSNFFKSGNLFIIYLDELSIYK